jgi:hypothetical protein
VLDRFAFVEVPESDADAVVEKVGGRKVRGTTLKLERAKS